MVKQSRAYPISLPEAEQTLVALPREDPPGAPRVGFAAATTMFGTATDAALPVSCPAEAEPAWPSLAATELPPAAPFPLEVLPRAMADYARSVAQALPCPTDLVAVAALGAAAAAIGNARHLRVKSGWVEGPRLWCAVVCEPGAKKSPALAAATRPLRDAQRQFQRDYQAAHRTYEAVRRAPGGEPLPTPPRMRQCFTADTTREGLTALLEANPRGLALIADELSGWALSQNQYKRGKGDDRQFWLSLWSGGELLVNRARDRGRPTAYVSQPMLSVLGCLPPAALGQLRAEKDGADGFSDRILFSWPDAAPSGWTDAEPDPAAEEAFAELFRRLLALDLPSDPATGEVRPRVLGWTEAGRRAWVGYINRLADDLNRPTHSEILRGPWAKLEGYGARLALVLHVCRGVMHEAAEMDIDETSMRAADRLVAYFQAHARRVYARLSPAGGGRSDDSRAVLDWVRRHRADLSALSPPRFSWRCLRRDLQNRFAGRADVLRRALRELEEAGYLRAVAAPAPRLGRPPEADYWVHPDLVGVGAAAGQL